MEYIKSNKLLDEIFQLYEDHGSEEYSGEKVSQLEHMLQAGQLALQEGYNKEVILAAFFHDIGHLLPVHDESESMNGYGVMDHEKLGAHYLAGLGFSEGLCKLIGSHVNAKRYLTYKFPEYYKQLSEASKVTLEYQGGKMNKEESEAFEADPLFELYIKMRKWDEAAKIPKLPTPPVNYFRKLANEYLNDHIF